MVRYRTDPRGPHGAELYRWSATVGPFRTVHFLYNKYRFMDWATKHPRICIASALTGLSIAYGSYMMNQIYTGANKRNPNLINTAERGFQYHEWVFDKRRIRGEWNNNFKCWTDHPDCGKDFKIKYRA